MRNESSKYPAQKLAEGFATYAITWAQEQQASESSLTVVWQAAYETSIATSEGHVCTTISEVAASLHSTSEEDISKLMLASGIVGTPEAPGVMPLILDSEGRIYLNRYFDYERRLANRLLACQSELAAPDEVLRQQLERIFPANADAHTVDWQKLAIALALQQRLTIISGGPGTGKTTTVVNLLACLLAQNPDCRIALAAPTGKAAARMQEAIRQRMNHLPSTLRELMPNESFTVHRLLGVASRTEKFIHHASNPLPIDALVIDEASMLDLALATQLFEAVPPDARIILLGDKDQLSAVEAGAVFSEISADPTLSIECKASLSQLTQIPVAKISPPTPRKALPLQDCAAWLTESYRFPTESSIGRMALAISNGEADRAMAHLQTDRDTALAWLSDGNRVMQQTTWQTILEAYDGYRQAITAFDASKKVIFEAFDHFRVLCAIREGARGSVAVNRQLDDFFRQSTGRESTGPEWYAGRPVIILRNDYLLQVFNGDIGIALPDEEQNPMIYFPDNEGGFRAIAPSRLPEHETAFAVTVHKSQGSEFDNVLLLLPTQPHRVVSRELLYTGLTRARKKVIVAGSEELIRNAVDSPIERRSGLIRRMKDEINTLNMRQEKSQS